MKTLVSKGLATEVYNWGYYYYIINEKGITHVKDHLGYTDERLKPATFMAKADVKTSSAAREGRGPARGGRGPRPGKTTEEQEVVAEVQPTTTATAQEE